jgi:thiol-disulfide isomerase/thioredoxin
MTKFFLRRRVLTLLVGAVSFCVALYVLRAGGEPKPDEQADKDGYAVPKTDDVKELIKFIEGVRAERPPQPSSPASFREYARYMRSAPPAIAEAAKKVLSLTKDDPKSEDYGIGSAALLETKVMGFIDADGDGRAKILDDVIAHLKEYGVRKPELGAAFGISQALEETDEKLAARAYGEFAKLVEASDDKEISALKNAFAGPGRRLGIVGSKMEVFGSTLDGAKFDWKKYEGKVVLIDFWATWCGPCVAELPNMKEAYDKYHDKGFEIVGINLDQRAFAVEEFLKKESLPWPQVRNEGEESSMAEYYGINAIPFLALVGRDGKVITTDARGRDLHKHLEELFGPTSE